MKIWSYHQSSEEHSVSYAYFNFVSDKVEMVLLGAVEYVHFGGSSTAHVLEGEPSIINNLWDD